MTHVGLAAKKADGAPYGTAAIDEEHEQLKEWIDELVRAAHAGESAEDLEFALTRLIDETIKHFAHEESFMETFAYDQAHHHSQDHKVILEMLEGLKRGIKSGGLALTADFALSIRDTMESHVAGADGHFTEFLARYNAG